MNLVAPIIPEYNPAGAQLMLQGFQAVANANAQRRAHQLATDKMVQDDVQAERAGQIAQEKMSNQLSYQMQALELRGERLDMQQSAAALIAHQNQEKERVGHEFLFEAHKRGMFDANPDPLEYWKGLNDPKNGLKAQYGFSHIPQVRAALKDFDAITEEHTLNLPQNIEITTDPDTKQTIKKGLNYRKIPVGQVYENLQSKDPNVVRATTEQMEVGGFFREKKVTKKVDKPGWFGTSFGAGPVDETTTVTVPGPSIANLFPETDRQKEIQLAKTAREQLMIKFGIDEDAATQKLVPLLPKGITAADLD